ncbi:hypothetical protein [Telluribacter sp. SYSU D00476]|uniref:hypothetical protein n=1 Tax=Telluribacter sp. SYSU D00476 TaxID=2811430 RepID=UPI001FF0E2E9|nr:hypothetical protein [Telluribacter sp. SYSU D00476]
MKITKTYDWQGEDFRYDAECEHCGHVLANQPGKDDYHFYNQAVPAMECPNCHQSSTLQSSEEPLPPIAPEHDPNITK